MACRASPSPISAAWRRPPASACCRSATSRTRAMPPRSRASSPRSPASASPCRRPGFLNGLTALAHATTNCFPMILVSGSSEREVVDLQQGDYEEMDQLAIAKPLCKAAYRVLHAAGHRHRLRARHPRGRVRPSRRRLSRPAGQALRPGDERRCRHQVAGEGGRRGAGAVPGPGRRQARARCAEGGQASADHPRQGRGLRPVPTMPSAPWSRRAACPSCP